MVRTLEVEPVIEYKLYTNVMREARDETGMSISEIARRLKLPDSSYRELESHKKAYNQLSQLQIENIAKALGGFKISAKKIRKSANF